MNAALKKPAWRTVTVVMTLVVTIGRGHFDGVIRNVLVALACMLFLFKVYQGLKAGLNRIANARQQAKRGAELWRELLPPWFRGVAVTDGLIYLEFVTRVLHLTPPSKRLFPTSANDSAFSLCNGNVSTLLVPLAVIGLLTDVPLSQVIIRILEPRHALWVHVVFLALALWGFVWIVGDRFAVKTRRHLVDRERILLGVGFRWEVYVPLSTIQHCGPVEGRPREWQAKREVVRSQVWSVTPIDPPNVLLELRTDQARNTTVLRMGVAVASRRYIAVYVDEPEAFIALVRREITAIDDEKRDE